MFLSLLRLHVPTKSAAKLRHRKLIASLASPESSPIKTPPVISQPPNPRQSNPAARFVQSAESTIKRVIFDFRFLALLAVGGSLAGSVLCFLNGCVYIGDAYKGYWTGCLKGVHSGQMVLRLVEDCSCAEDWIFLGFNLLIRVDNMLNPVFIDKSSRKGACLQQSRKKPFAQWQLRILCSKAMDMSRCEVSRVFIGAGCNRIVHNVSWGASGLVAFGANNVVAIFDPKTSQILTTLSGHEGTVNCTHWTVKRHLAAERQPLHRSRSHLRR